MTNGTKPRKAKNEIPVTYNLGWWAYQNNLQIDSFKIDIIKSELNLFNSKSLISYKISGTLKNFDNDVRFIKSVHISEKKITKEPSMYADEGNIDAEIQITPIVGYKDSKGTKAGNSYFSFTNELKIESMGWGENLILLKCGKFEQTIKLSQTK